MQQIVEIQEILTQGTTEPVLCRAEDGDLYVVKDGLNAGRKALVAEWIAGRIAQDMGLPIPDFDTLELPKHVAQESIQERAAHLAKMPCFGSRYVENTMELQYHQRTSIDPEVRRRLLLFDWWVQNEDRTLTADAGNPNLLWVAGEGRMVVIDHNLALDQVDAQTFWGHHVFREDRAEWDKAFMAWAEGLMKRTLDRVSSYWEEMPSEWTDGLSELTLEGVTVLLRRFEDAPKEFWQGT